MIDNMELGSGSILMQGGRSGAWFTANDGAATSMQSPAPGQPCIPELIPGGGMPCDAHAQHTYGGGSMWALLGFSLDEGKPYDASAYTGITFRAMGQAGSLRIEVPTSETLPPSANGTCMITDTCYDHAFATFPISPAWQVVKVPFTALTQAGWGTPAPFDPHAMIFIEFEASPATTYDFWIDDVSFY
jgi:hypothetical protein